MPDRPSIRNAILEQVWRRGPEKSICPSEVTRALGGPQWRELMPCVREVGLALAEEGCIVVLQKGNIVNPHQVKGPIPYRIVPDLENREKFL